MLVAPSLGLTKVTIKGALGSVPVEPSSNSLLLGLVRSDSFDYPSPMHENTVFPLASIFALGLGSQWLAWKLKLPAIVTLIAAGLLAGPVTGFLHPDQLFGQFLQPMVALSVAIILFEGGLSLKFSDLTESGTQKSVRRLVLFGSLVTWVLVSLLAMKLLHFTFELALLLAAILVVTGPTVILPLLRQVGLSGRVGVILKWEGMVNDPIGALLAVVVFEAIRGGELSNFSSIAVMSLFKTVLLTVVGAGIFAAALLFCLRRFWIPDHLQASLALGFALLLYGLCDIVQPESGLAAVTLLGIFVSHDKEGLASAYPRVQREPQCAVDLHPIHHTLRSHRVGGAQPSQGVLVGLRGGRCLTGATDRRVYQYLS